MKMLIQDYVSSPRQSASAAPQLLSINAQSGGWEGAGELTLARKQIADLNVKKLSCVLWTWPWEGAAVGQMAAGIDGCDSESLLSCALLQSQLLRGCGAVRCGGCLD